MINIKNLSIGVAVVVITMLSAQNSYLGYLVAIAQVIGLMILLVFKYQMALPYLIFCLGTNLEFSTFVNNGEASLYNLSNIKIAGANIGVYMLILTAIAVFFAKKRLANKENFSRFHSCFILILSLMYAQSVIISILDYYFDLSLLASFNLSHLIGLFYLQFWPYITLLMCIQYIKIHKNGITILKSTIIFTLISTLVACLLVNLIGFQGTYGDSQYYLSPTIIFLGPFILLMLKDPVVGIKDSVSLFLFAFLIIIPIAFLNLAGGKIILFAMASLLLSGIGKIHSKIFALLGFSLLLFVLVVNLNSEGILLMSKLDEVISLLNFVSGNWYEILQPSTRFRVDEFINIYQHYLNNKAYMINGFGIVGGAPDYIGGYGFTADGSFPQVEYSNGYFISYHEITSFVIKYGLIGLIILLSLIVYACKYNGRSFFLVVGVVWFSLFWGYSQTLAVVGAATLAVGIMEVRSSKLNGTKATKNLK